MAAIIVTCPECQARVRVPEDSLGRGPVRCGGCKAAFVPQQPAHHTMTLKQAVPPPPPSGASSGLPSGAGQETPSPQTDQEGTISFGARLRPTIPSGTDQPTGPGKQAGTDTVTAGPRREAIPPLKDGPTIPGYLILEVLGRGGMGVVYKAIQEGLNRLVAVKMILGGSHAGAEEVSRFRIEAEAVARLHHPQIVQIHEVKDHEGRPYFSLEYCSGGSLARKINGTPLDPQEAAALVEKLAHGIHAAHLQNVIHRDLKPANVLLSAEGEPKITDFGLAKRLDDDSQTQTGAVMGTPSYMAPEQARGDIKAIGPPADIYALGAVLYELLTGRPPFKSSTQVDTVMQVIHQEPVPPSQLQPRVPRDLETICLKCLQKSPEARYLTAEKLAEELERFRKGMPILARPVSRPERAWRWCRRNPMVAALMASVLFLLVAGASVGWLLAWEANRARQQADQSAIKATNLALLAQKNEENARQEKVRADLAAQDAKDQARLAKKNEEAARKEQFRADQEAQRAIDQAKLAQANESRAKEESERANRVAKFLIGLFDSTDPVGFTGYAFGPDPGHGSKMTARALLDRGRVKAKQELEKQPILLGSLLTTVGSVYRTMGLTDEARPLLEEGLKLRRAHLGEEHMEVADGWYQLGWMFHQDGDEHAALECYKKSEAIARAHGPEGITLLSRCRFNTAWILAQQRFNDQAEAIFREVLAERRERLGPNHLEVGNAQCGLAALLFQTGRGHLAVPLVLNGVKILSTYHGDKSFAAAVTLGQDALVAATFKNYDAAEKKFLQVAATIEEKLGGNHPYVAWAYGFLGEISIQAGKFQDAERYYARCLQICKDGLGLTHPLMLRAVEPYVERLAASGRFDEACKVYEEALDHQRKRRGDKHPILVLTLGSYGEFAESQGRYEEAEAHFRRAAAMARELPIGSCPPQAEILFRLGMLMRQENPDGAVAIFEEGLQAVAYSPEPGIFEVVLKGGLAQALTDLERFPEASALFDELGPLAKAKAGARKDLASQIAGLRRDFPGQVARGSGLQAGDIVLAAASVELTPWLAITSPVLRRLQKSAGPPAIPLDVGSPHPDRLTAEDPIDRFLHGSHSRVYAVTLEEGQTYRITLRSKAFDCFLRLENHQGRSLVTDDDGGGGLDSRILYRCKVTGKHRVVATTFKAGEVGDFTLQVEQVKVGLPAKFSFRKADRLDNTDPLDRVRTLSHHKVFSVELEAGKNYQIDLVSAAFDCFLRLEDAGGNPIAENDDGGEGLNSRLRFTPPKTAPYRLVVTSYKGKQVGPFVLTVAP